MPLPLRRLSEIQPQPTSWLWRDRIPRGALTVVEADPGVGKSTVLCDIAARVTTGRTMPVTNDTGIPSDVWFLTTEDSDETLQTRLATNQGDFNRFHCLEASHIELPRLPTSIEEFRQGFANYPPALVIFDPLQDFLESPMTSERGVRAATRPLIALAQQYGVALVGIRHLTKSGANNLLYRGGGAVAVSAIARSVLLIAPDPRLPERRILAQIKSSFGPRSPILGFRFGQSRRGVFVDWIGRVSYTDSDLAIGEHGGSAPALDEATYTLFTILAEGPVHSIEVLRSAANAGVSRRTLERAKRRLRVVSERTGWGPGGRSLWRLPNNDELVDLLRNRDLDELATQLFHGDERQPPLPPDPSTLPLITIGTRRHLIRD